MATGPTVDGRRWPSAPGIELDDMCKGRCITGEVLLLDILVVYLSVTRYAACMDASWLF